MDAFDKQSADLCAIAQRVDPSAELLVNGRSVVIRFKFNQARESISAIRVLKEVSLSFFRAIDVFQGKTLVGHLTRVADPMETFDDELADVTAVSLRATGAQITVEKGRVIVFYTYDQTERPYAAAKALQQLKLRAYEGVDVYHGQLKIAAFDAAAK